MNSHGKTRINQILSSRTHKTKTLGHVIPITTWRSQRRQHPRGLPCKPTASQLSSINKPNTGITHDSSFSRSCCNSRSPSHEYSPQTKENNMHHTLPATNRDIGTLGTQDRIVELNKGEAPDQRLCEAFFPEFEYCTTHFSDQRDERIIINPQHIPKAVHSV